MVVRATTHDFDFLFEDDDSNIPVTFDPDTKKLVTPEVQSWSELIWGKLNSSLANGYKILAM